MVLTRSLIHLMRPYDPLQTIDSAHRCREIPTLFKSAFSPKGSSLEELTGEVTFLNKNSMCSVGIEVSKRRKARFFDLEVNDEK